MYLYVMNSVKATMPSMELLWTVVRNTLLFGITCLKALSFHLVNFVAECCFLLNEWGIHDIEQRNCWTAQ